MIKKLATASLLVVSLTVGAAACGTADVKQSKFESELQKTSKQMTATAAKCVTDKLYAKYDQKTINKLYTADKAEDIDAKVTADFQAMVTSCLSAK